jgi:hypothetical protein
MFGIAKPTGEIMCHLSDANDGTRFRSFVAWKPLQECVGFTHTGKAYSPYLATHPLLAQVRMRTLNIIYNGILQVVEIHDEDMQDITIQKLKNVRD